MYYFTRFFFPETKAPEFEELQKEYEEKILKKEKLKKQIELTRQRLEKIKKEAPEEQMKTCTALKHYNSLRDEYNALLTDAKKMYKIKYLP